MNEYYMDKYFLNKYYMAKYVMMSVHWGAGSVTVFCITCNPSAKKLQIWDMWREWSQVEKAANIRLAKFAFTSSSTLPGYDDNDDDDDDDDDDDGEDDDDDDYDDDDHHHQQ